MSCFITIEGIEGSGKSTLAQKLKLELEQRVQELVLTREPGGTELGKQIRETLLDPENFELEPNAELLLFSADRAQHLAQVVRPALQRGATVLCDRYIHSMLAYQGFARGLDLSSLEFLNQFASGGLLPDLVLLLDLSVERGLARARARAKQEWSRFEEQELDFHKKVRAGFLELAKRDTNRIKVLDADRHADDICAAALVEINELLSH